MGLNIFDKVRAFHDAFNLRNEIVPSIPPENVILLREKLIREEFYELMDELNSPKLDLAKIAKESCDILYVLAGLGADFGIDLDAVFDAVHQSNMSKLDENGKPIYNEFGKVMKSKYYKEPDIEAVLDKQKENL